MSDEATIDPDSLIQNALAVSKACLFLFEQNIETMRFNISSVEPAFHDPYIDLTQAARLLKVQQQWEQSLERAEQRKLELEGIIIELENRITTGFVSLFRSLLDPSGDSLVAQFVKSLDEDAINTAKTTLEVLSKISSQPS